MERQDEFTKRLLEVASTAEQFMKPDEILVVFLSAGLSYAMRHNPNSEIAELLRDAAERIEQAKGPTVN